MQTTTLERTGQARRSPAEPTTLARPSRTLRAASLAGAAAVLLAGGWSLTLDGPAPAPGPGEVAVDAGLARVDQVVSAARPRHAMPGMGTDDDPVAEGERRVSVDVTLRAPQDENVSYLVDRFRLDAPGAAAVAPHKSVLPGDELPSGTTLSGTLVFDVPADATSARLSYDGGRSTSVTLPPEVGAPAPAQQAVDGATAGPGQHGAGHGVEQG